MSKNLKILLILICLGGAEPALGLTASKVAFEARPDGIFRVYVTYTVPALKEVKEAFVEFNQRKEAEAYYYDLLRGADFYLNDPSRREFKTGPRQPTPW
ncbi:MAG: hypothetical protein RIQ81_1400 [Pseudomonadota bacterium]|jgi:hypothetical protein